MAYLTLLIIPLLFSFISAESFHPPCQEWPECKVKCPLGESEAHVPCSINGELEECSCSAQAADAVSRNLKGENESSSNQNDGFSMESLWSGEYGTKYDMLIYGTVGMAGLLVISICIFATICCCIFCRQKERDRIAVITIQGQDEEQPTPSKIKFERKVEPQTLPVIRTRPRDDLRRKRRQPEVRQEECEEPEPVQPIQEECEPEPIEEECPEEEEPQCTC